MSHITHLSESYHTRIWVVSCRFTHAKSCHTCEAMSHMCTLTFCYLYAYKYVMSRIWASHVTRINESRHTYARTLAAICNSCVSWRIHSWDTTDFVCDKTKSYLCATRLNHICDMSHLQFMCGVTHSYNSFVFVTWLIHTCDRTHSYARHDWFACVTWLIHMCDMTQSSVRHDSFIFVIRLIHTRKCLVHSFDMAHSYLWCMNEK